MLFRSGVDGVYDKDPKIHKDAVKFDDLSHQYILEKGLGIMDSTAASLCKDNKVDIIVFNMLEKGNIKRAILGEKIGTIVK